MKTKIWTTLTVLLSCLIVHGGTNKNELTAGSESGGPIATGNPPRIFGIRLGDRTGLDAPDRNDGRVTNNAGVDKRPAAQPAAIDSPRCGGLKIDLGTSEPYSSGSRTAGEVSGLKTNHGEAVVWYLYHSGWAVKTENHFFIFDYRQVNSPTPSDASLDKGFVNSNEIKDQSVIVFVSHTHGDHFDRRIFKWNDTIKNIKYVLGWPGSNKPGYYYANKDREIIEIDDVKIYTINHRFDGIPEAAFLVDVDGLRIYHSGDHGGYRRPEFKENMEYLSTIANQTDMVFHMAVDGGCRWNEGVVNAAIDAIERLHPTVMFPMHGGGCEHYYKKFSQYVNAMGTGSVIHPAERSGDRYFYKKNNEYKPE